MKPYLNIESGSHASADQGMCVMEAVAYFVGEKHTDHPSCTSRSIGSAMRRFNDSFPFENDQERTETLLPLIPIVVGTATTNEDEIQRGFIAADFAVRVFAPISLEEVGLKEEAEEFRSLPQVVDTASAKFAQSVAKPAADAIRAAAAANAIRAAAAAAAAASYAANANASYAADDATANAIRAAVRKDIHEAIKIAFTEMIKNMSAVGQKQMDMSEEAKEEFSEACKLVCKV